MIAEVVTCIAMNGDCNSWGDHGGDKGDHGEQVNSGDQGDRGDCGINLSDSGEQGDKVSKGERSIGGYLVTAQPTSDLTMKNKYALPRPLSGRVRYKQRHV